MTGDSLSNNGMREHIRVVAVIQARMNSVRLPGKVLKPIAGEPLLWHILHRLKGCRLLEEIAVATSANPADDPIAQWCNSQGVTLVRGPKDDVLALYALAAEKLDADIIVRVPSDTPFLDAGYIDHLVATLIEQQGDQNRQAEEKQGTAIIDRLWPRFARLNGTSGHGAKCHSNQARHKQ